MAVLENAKHEKFVQAVVSGETATRAYTAAGYKGAGAKASAHRLLTNANLRTRIKELREELAAGMIAAEIGNRQARVAALQRRWEQMHQVIKERGESPEFAGVAGGTTGLLCRDFKGKDATPIYRVDTGLLAEMRMHEKQAAQELGQWSEEREDDRSTEARRFTGTFEELLILYRMTTAAS